MTNVVSSIWDSPDPRVSLLIATPEQSGVITALHRAAFETAWSESSINQLLEADTAVAFLASVDRAYRPAGFVIGRLLADEAEIITIAVAPAERRCGIGHALLGGFMRAVALAGAHRVVFEVAVDNQAALQLYASRGFKTVGRRTGYYEGGADGAATDALILAAQIEPPPNRDERHGPNI